VQLFRREYPNGDRGGGDFCLRVTQDRTPLSLHRLWDGLLTSSNNTRTLRDMAIELRNRFPRNSLAELATDDAEAWAKESFGIAAKIAYQNGSLRGTPKGQRSDCREMTDAAVLPVGYVATVKKIAERRMALAGDQQATLLQQVRTCLQPMWQYPEQLTSFISDQSFFKSVLLKEVWVFL
jgi:hypothetical protein